MTGCCRHCWRDSDGACRYLAAGIVTRHEWPCSKCHPAEYARALAAGNQNVREKYMPGKCCLCTKEAETYHPDPNRPGEQIGYCGFHEPEDS